MTVNPITKIKDLLSDSSKWCKQAFARNIEGKHVHPLSKDACSWCIYGAMTYLNINPADCAQVLGRADVINDNSNHKQLLMKLEKAEKEWERINK